MNEAKISGTVYKEPIVRYAASGMCWGSWTMAVPSDSGKKKDYISCKVFGALAEEFEKMARKDMFLTVEGHISSGSYIAKDGHKVYTTDVVAEKIDYSQGLAPSAADEASVPSGFSEVTEDFPF